MTDDLDGQLRSPVRVLRPHATAEAMQFDGTRECAIAMARSFPRRIALAVEQDDELLAFAIDALGTLALHRVDRGSWLVHGSGLSDRLQLFSDDHFRAVYVLDTRDSR